MFYFSYSLPSPMLQLNCFIYSVAHLNAAALFLSLIEVGN